MDGNPPKRRGANLCQNLFHGANLICTAGLVGCALKMEL
jgi:hypothetical protein